MPTTQTGLTRRSLLTKAGQTALAAGTAATLLNAVAGAQTSAPSDRKLGFAFVGLGGFALGQLMPSISKTKHCRIAALVSGSPTKAARTARRYKVPETSVYSYENYDQIAQNPDVDVIYIVLPTGMHAEYTIRAAKAGKHILCEKPMAVSAAECQQMIDACKQADRKLMIGYRVRYDPFNQTAIKMCRDGSMGRIIHISSDHGFPMGDPNAWRLNKKLAGGGALLDIGIYALNACRYLAGEDPIEITAQTYTPKDDPRFQQVEDGCVWTMKFPSGILSTCSTSYTYANQNRYRVVGTEGWFEAEPGTAYNDNRMYVSRGWQVQERKIEQVNQFAAEMDHFAECILQNKQPLTPGEEGLADLRVIDAIYESANTGKTVKLA
jgi:predicted dehydrogenase